MAQDIKEKYINPYTDFGFKKLFGTEMNKDLLISFLNALFHDEQVIKDVKYLNSEKLGEGYGDRKAIFDVNLSRLLERPAALQERVFEKLFKQAEIAKFSPEERQDYEESVKIYRDLKNSLDTAEWKAKVQIARKMKADGIPIVTIMKYTKLPLEEIERL